MLIIQSQFGSNNDFSVREVRRLCGILADFNHLSKSALDKMNEILDTNPNISLQEVKNILAYELEMLGLRNT